MEEEEEAKDDDDDDYDDNNDKEDDKEDVDDKYEEEEEFFWQKFLKLPNIPACQIWWGKANANKLVLTNTSSITTTTGENRARWTHYCLRNNPATAEASVTYEKLNRSTCNSAALCVLLTITSQTSLNG